MQPVTKPGKHGTLYRYELVYRDNSDMSPEATQVVWAYDQEHAIEKFFDGPDFEGWTLLKIARVNDVPRHRWRWHTVGIAT